MLVIFKKQSISVLCIAIPHGNNRVVNVRLNIVVIEYAPKIRPLLLIKADSTMEDLCRFLYPASGSEYDSPHTLYTVVAADKIVVERGDHVALAMGWKHRTMGSRKQKTRTVKEFDPLFYT